MASPVRRNKVAKRIKQEIGNILLTEMKDPRMGMASVVRVKVSADLRAAIVFVSVLGNDTEKAKTMAAVHHARGFIQGLVAKRVALRFAPILKFQLDESIERSIRISKILDEVSKEWKEGEEEQEKGSEEEKEPDGGLGD